MSIPLSNILVKHKMKITDRLISEIQKNPNLLYNGTYYLLTPDKTFHYHAVKTGDFSFYNEYVKAANDEQSHCEEKFRNLIKNFDLNKFDKIKVHCYEHTNKYWVQDGSHRLAILSHFGGG